MSTQSEFPTSDLVSSLTQLITDDKRILVAIAGPPASGKSTLAAQLTAQMNQQQGSELAVVLPMDGFHLDNTILDSRDLRAVKGAPETFDTQGLMASMQRLLGDDHDIAVPVFDRELDLAKAGARVITRDHRLVLIEGNYLLLDEEPWSTLLSLFDYRVYLDVPENVLRQRLIQRWLSHDHTPEQARERAESNDLPNARLVAHKRLVADYIMTDGLKTD